MFNEVEIDEYEDDEFFSVFFQTVLRSPARNDPRSGLLQRSGGRLFQSLAVLGKMGIFVCLF